MKLSKIKNMIIYQPYLPIKNSSIRDVVLGVIAFLFGLIAIANAGDFDGSKPLSGVTGKIIEINQHKIIDDVDPDTVGLPKNFLIDFISKTLRPSKDSLVRRTIKFKSLEHIENKMVMQGVDEGVNGVDDGLAWSLTSWGTPKLASGQNSGKKHVVLGIPIFAK